MNRLQPAISRLLVFFSLFFLLTGCTEADIGSARRVSPEADRYEITVDGRTRTYYAHLPRGYRDNATWPVVIMFHGGGGTAATAMATTGWIPKADQEGFLAVFPEGTSPNPSKPGRFVGNPQTWNDGSTAPTVRAAEQKVPDIAFVSTLLRDLKDRFSVDHRRIYVTGFSNGGSMTFRIARELSSDIAAAAPVAGTDYLKDRVPARPVPIMYVVGDSDPLSPLGGGEVHIGFKSYGEKPTVPDMINRWKTLHDCHEAPTMLRDLGGLKGVTYCPPDRGNRVVYYSIEGHGHHWPGGATLLPKRVAGNNVSKFHVTDYIWEFFRSHALPEASAAHYVPQTRPKHPVAWSTLTPAALGMH